MYNKVYQKPQYINTNKPNYIKFNTRENCLQPTALRLLYFFLLLFFSLLFFSESKSRNFWSEATHIHPKKAQKTRAFYQGNF